MSEKKWNNELFKRMAQVLMIAAIMTGLSTSIIQGEVFSAGDSPKEDTVIAHEALATAGTTPESIGLDANETASETMKIATNETTPETMTTETNETEIETEAETDASSEKSVLLIEKSKTPEENIEVFIDLLQFHPNYLADILSLHDSWDELETTLTETIAGYSGDWSVYVKDLKTGNTISLNEHSMESASLIKLYVMGAVMEQINNRKLEETSRITSLLNNMITVSDNESTNELVRYLSKNHDHKEGMTVVNDFIKRHGFDNTAHINGLADSSLWGGNGVNTTSTQNCGKLLELIYNGELISHMASYRMESLLLGQKVTYKIPSALPNDAISASKTGEVSGVENDTAIIYSKGGDFILCIMSANWNGQNTAIRNIHEITKIVYQYFNLPSESLAS